MQCREERRAFVAVKADSEVVKLLMRNLILPSKPILVKRYSIKILKDLKDGLLLIYVGI